MRKFLFLAVFILLLGGLSFLLKMPTQAQNPAFSWQSSGDFSSGQSHPLPSFSARGYFYVLLTDRSFRYAKINSDGSLGTWQTATAQHNEASSRGHTVIVLDDVPYLLRNGRVEKLVIDTSGNITQIQQVGSASGGADSIGTSTYYWNSAVVADFGTQKYVFHLGGFDCCQEPHYSNNSQVFRASSTASAQWVWQQVGTGPYANAYKAAFYRPENASYGFIYTVDLNPYGKPLYRVKVKSDGSFEGGWTEISSLPVGNDNNLGDYFVSGNKMYAVRGSKVFYATLNSQDGSLSAWAETTALPAVQIDKTWEPSAGSDHSEGPSFAIVGGRIYLTGQRKVFYAALGDAGTSHPCREKALIGDYDCNNTVNVEDFNKWKTDFGNNLSDLSYFEFWRRASL